MFGKKPPANKTTITDKIEQGELSVEDGQKLLDLKKMEAEVNDSQQSVIGHRNLVDLRNIWGQVILAILMVTIISDIVLVYLVGTGIWTFEGNKQFLDVVAAQQLAQVIGLAAIVLKSLFPPTIKP